LFNILVINFAFVLDLGIANSNWKFVANDLGFALDLLLLVVIRQLLLFFNNVPPDTSSKVFLVMLI
jgi:hypothetical protein